MYMQYVIVCKFVGQALVKVQLKSANKGKVNRDCATFL